jgi:hypothetical protein
MAERQADGESEGAKRGSPGLTPKKGNLTMRDSGACGSSLGSCPSWSFLSFLPLLRPVPAIVDSLAQGSGSLYVCILSQPSSLQLIIQPRSTFPAIGLKSTTSTGRPSASLSSAPLSIGACITALASSDSQPVSSERTRRRLLIEDSASSLLLVTAHVAVSDPTSSAVPSIFSQI